MKVVESLGEYRPPYDVVEAVNRLLDSVSNQHLAGLGEIVLTTSDQLPASERKRKHRQEGLKYRKGDARGTYKSARNARRASIELLMDNIHRKEHPWILRIPALREAALGSTLFHELGHHIHATHVPERGNPEAIARRWEKDLLGRHLRRCHWYLVPIAKVWKLFVRLTRKHESKR